MCRFTRPACKCSALGALAGKGEAAISPKGFRHAKRNPLFSVPRHCLGLWRSRFAGRPLNLQPTPPSTLGVSVCWLPAGVSEADAVPLVGDETPFSNTGFIGLTDEACAIDFLSVTVALSELAARDTPQNYTVPRTAEQVLHFVGTTPSLGQELFDLLFYGTAISCDGFEAKGLFGYTHRADLRIAGVQGSVGVMGIGGNGNTLYVSLSGAGTAWIRNWRKVAIALQSYSATITRVDLAFDDFHGEYFDLPFIDQLARTGYFDTENGLRVRRSKIDDLGSLRGSSLYVGRKGTKEFNLYEKGKQLQSPNIAWVRGEGRLWSKNRFIPYDVLTQPMLYMRGEFPAFAAFMPFRGTASKSVLMKAKADASFDSACRWLLLTAGKTLNFVSRASERSDVSASRVMQMLSRDGTPKRFAGVPEEVSFSQAESYFEKGVTA